MIPGLRPGPEMLTDNPGMTFTIVWRECCKAGSDCRDPSRDPTKIALFPRRELERDLAAVVEHEPGGELPAGFG